MAYSMQKLSWNVTSEQMFQAADKNLWDRTAVRTEERGLELSRLVEWREGGEDVIAELHYNNAKACF